VVRRVSVPSADDLFRRTGRDPQPAADDEPAGEQSPARAGRQQPSGRVRHDEKVTVYVTADELTDLEAARLNLRSAHGLVVDRGRLIREAVAMALADLEAEGEESPLVRRLNRS
jgi:hypothetical protein